MATLATFFKRPALLSRAEHASPARAGNSDGFRLRELPHEDVYFYSRRIDNSRVVREADPKARQECWSTIGAACIVAALLTTVLAPSVATTLAGYKLQQLKQEQAHLLDERRVLDVEEAALLSPARLEELARTRQLANPAPGQVIHLDGKTDAALAMNVKK